MKRLLFFLNLTLMFNVQLVFAESTSDSLVRQLTSVKTFSSDFVQEVLGDKEVVVQRAVGKMQFNRSCYGQALFYWQVISPSISTMYFRDNSIIIYDPDLGQATVKKVNYNDPAVLPLLLLTGDSTKILNHFSVTSKDGRHYILQPKSKDKDTLLLGVILDITSEGAVQKIQYQTTLGPRTQITFNHEKINQPLKRAIFFEKLPKGTDFVHVE